MSTIRMLLKWICTLSVLTLIQERTANFYAEADFSDNKVGLNNSVIVGTNATYLATLTNMLKPVAQGGQDWKLCWRASQDGWASTRFHSLCDGKGPTITIIKVGKYIFGGYTSVSWDSSCNFRFDSEAYLFSMVNKPGWAPVKLNQTGKQSSLKRYSVYSCPSKGPTFGSTYDLLISSNASSSPSSYSDLGDTYGPPSGYNYGSNFAQTFLAGSFYFTPDEIETFYKKRFISPGTASRGCFQKSARGNTNCSSAEFKNLKDQMAAIVGGFQSDLNAQQVLSQLKNATQPIKNDIIGPRQIYGGDLVIAVNILVQVAKYNSNYGNVSSTNDFENVANVASNLLEPINSKTWKELDKGAQNSSQILVKAVNDYAMGVAGTFNRSTKSKVVRTNNLMLRIDRLDHDFPLRSRGKGLKIEYNESSIYLPPQAFSSSQDSRVATVIYLTLNDVLQLAREKENEDGEAVSANTTIVSSTVYPRSPDVLSEPVKIVVQNKKMRISSDATSLRKCVFWRPEESATWKTSGCRLVPSESDVAMTTCECDHLTIFAALMDPYGSTWNEDDKDALEIISIVGCSISLLAVLISIIALTLFCKPIKTRAEVLLNLCASIAITCALVISEQSARKKAVCPVVAALLHYFLLVLFSWMLCEGVLHYIVIVLPFGSEAHVEDKMKYFYLFGWGFPAIIVTISLAVTQANGYGSTAACWLDAKSGLIWAFIVPALAVILINVVVYILVIRRMMIPVDGKVKDKTQIEKVRTGVKASAVILPLLGITWLFGLLSFSSDTIAFKYIFAIFNSLQGLMIFIFHSAGEIRNAVRRRLEIGNRKRNQSHPDNSGNLPSKATKMRSRGTKNNDKELKETKT